MYKSLQHSSLKTESVFCLFVYKRIKRMHLGQKSQLRFLHFLKVQFFSTKMTPKWLQMDIPFAGLFQIFQDLFAHI